MFQSIVSIRIRCRSTVFIGRLAAVAILWLCGLAPAALGQAYQEFLTNINGQYTGFKIRNVRFRCIVPPGSPPGYYTLYPQGRAVDWM